MKQLCKYISDYMGLLVLCVAVLAFLLPDTLGHISPKWVSPLLGLVMFGMGLTLRLDDFRILLMRPWDIFLGAVAQFVLMPALAFLLTRLFQLDEAISIGVILVGCCPGGTASNLIAYLSKGDLALSIGITSTTTLLAPVVTPLLVWLLAGKEIDVDILAMFLSILWIIILPIVCGIIVKRLWPRQTERATAYLPAFSSLVIALLVYIVIAASSHRLLSGGLLVIAVVVLHNVLGLLFGYLLALAMRLPVAKRRTLCIEIGMQNSGLASSLASLHFAAYPLAIVPGAIFSVWHNISGAIVARIFARTRL